MSITNLANSFKLASIQPLEALTLKMILVLSSYTFDPTHEFVDDLVPGTNEATGYTRPTLATVTATQNDIDNRAELTFDPVTIASVAPQFIYAAWIYEFVTNDADSLLKWFVVLNKSANGEDLVLTPGATGVLHAVEV